MFNMVFVSITPLESPPPTSKRIFSFVRHVKYSAHCLLYYNEHLESYLILIVYKKGKGKLYIRMVKLSVLY